MQGGMPVNEVVASRHSSRTFNPAREVPDSVLGQILWMSVGVNRAKADHDMGGNPADRCNPTAINRQEVTAYVFDRDGVWEYMPRTHSLALRAEGDHRALMAGTAEFSQDFVLDAPASILLVTDASRFEGDRAMACALLDAGIANQNLNLACASLGVATVPRATMDASGISALLGLSPMQIPALNNPVGYE